MTVGQRGTHYQIRQWTIQGFLAALLDVLIGGSFTVFLTWDRGDVETTGCGTPWDGSAADLHGERAGVFPDPALWAQVQDRLPDAIAWHPTELPHDYFALHAPGCSSFVRPSERPVAHGGIALEKVVVPLTRIES